MIMWPQGTMYVQAHMDVTSNLNQTNYKQMKSQQINFYMMPDDIAELDRYIKDQGFCIVAYSNTENKPLLLNTIVGLKELKAYLILPEFIDKIEMRYIEQQNKYLINDSHLPVIEYKKSVLNLSENKIRPGRLYINKQIYNKDNELIEIDEKTVAAAKKLFIWYKSHFKNIKINPRHTTKRVGSCVESQNLEIVLN